MSRNEKEEVKESYGQSLLKKRMYGKSHNEEEDNELDEAAKEAIRLKEERIKKQQKEEYQNIKSYHSSLKYLTLQSFKDRPDSITTVRVTHCD